MAMIINVRVNRRAIKNKQSRATDTGEDKTEKKKHIAAKKLEMMSSTYPQEKRGLTPVLMKGKFMLLIRHPGCYLFSQVRYDHRQCCNHINHYLYEPSTLIFYINKCVSSLFCGKNMFPE